MTLVALLALSAGAWAETTVTWVETDFNGKPADGFTQDNVTLTTTTSGRFSNSFYSSGKNTFTTTLGNFTKIEIVFINMDEVPGSIDGWTYEQTSAIQDGNAWFYSGKHIWTGNAESVSIQKYILNIQSITFTIASNAVPITWDNAAKTATIASMPAGNVQVNVNYFAQAELAMSTDATPVAIAPAAIASVPANTDAPIVTAGAVANIGTSEVKQGTLMYFVSQSTGDTAPEAPDYDTEGWSENVPTANGLAEGNAYVWYYIKGAEPTSGDRTDDNTRSDSDIKALGTTGIVTLGAEPTYDLTLKAANANTIDATQASKGTVSVKEGTGAAVDKTSDITDEGKLTAIKRGSEVKLKANNGYKFRKVVAKKAPFAANEYNEASWDDSGEKVVLTKKTAASEPTAVEDAEADVITWSDGWYTVSGNVTITGTVTLGADTHLILQDGAKLTISGQLYCNSGDGYSLYIYGQEAGDGKLNVSNDKTAIYVSVQKTIEIHGGEITATSSTSGTGFYSGGIKMYGGKLTATSGGMQGIFFGSGNFDVYGGEVVATSTGSGYAIKNGSGNKTLTVYGGTVKATGGTGSGTQAIYANVKSGTTGIKFYFTNTEGDWGDGAYYSTDTTAPTNRYAKAE